MSDEDVLVHNQPIVQDWGASNTFDDKLTKAIEKRDMKQIDKLVANLNERQRRNLYRKLSGE